MEKAKLSYEKRKEIQAHGLDKAELWNQLVKAELGDSGGDFINADYWREEPASDGMVEIPSLNEGDGEDEQHPGNDDAGLQAEAAITPEVEAGVANETDQARVVQGQDDTTALVPVEPAFPQDVISEALAFLASRFALINLKGKVWVVDRRNIAARRKKGHENSSWLIGRADAFILMTRALAEKFPQLDARPVCNQFIRDPQTTLYKGVEFRADGTTEGFLNLWIGHTIKPVKGNWELLANYLLFVICSNNRETYEYLLNYLAHALQKPEEKPGVMIVMQGKEGTGKGTLAYLLSLIWSATFIQVHNIADVLGNFTDALETSFMVFFDEALFAGDIKSTDRLKGLVTEPRININPKNQPVRSINSCHRFWAATNAKHFAKVSLNNRRDVFLEVSDGAMGRHEYWTELRKHIDEGGAAAMAYELLYERDISEFNVRVKPDTEGLTKQKIQSLDPIPAWWYEGLKLGTIDDGGWQGFIGSGDAIEAITRQAGRLYKPIRSTDFYEVMGEMCPSAKNKQPRVAGDRIRGLTLPSLEIARKEFEDWFGVKLDW